MKSATLSRLLSFIPLEGSGDGFVRLASHRVLRLLNVLTPKAPALLSYEPLLSAVVQALSRLHSTAAAPSFIVPPLHLLLQVQPLEHPPANLISCSGVACRSLGAAPSSPCGHVDSTSAASAPVRVSAVN